MNLVMRPSLSLFLICASIICAVASPFTRATQEDKNKAKSSGRINVKYDKSKDTTTVTLKPIALSGLAQERRAAPNIPLHQTDMEAFFTFPGQQPAKPVESVTLRFRVTSGNYFLLRDQPIGVALDRENKEKGRAIQLGTAKYSSNLKFNSVYEEYLTLIVPAEALRKVAAADTIEVYLGPIGYQLKENQRDALRELVSRMTP